MGNTSSNKKTILTDGTSIIRQLESICQIKPNIPSAITMRSYKTHNIVVSSQNPHLVLAVLKYVKRLLGIVLLRTAPIGKASSLIYAVEIINGKLACDDWTLILVDFMAKKFPNYRYVGLSSWKGYHLAHEDRIYFVPQKNIGLRSEGVNDVNGGIALQSR